MSLKRNIQCELCGEIFTAVGDGDEVKCPRCHRMLYIGDNPLLEAYYGGDGLETDYYDSDMEGAPGYFGGGE